VIFDLLLPEVSLEAIDRDSKLKDLDDEVGNLIERVLDEREVGECGECDGDGEGLVLEVNIGGE
jgi:hypothetical protein